MAASVEEQKRKDKEKTRYTYNYTTTLGGCFTLVRASGGSIRPPHTSPSVNDWGNEGGVGVSGGSRKGRAEGKDLYLIVIPEPSGWQLLALAYKARGRQATA